MKITARNSQIRTIRQSDPKFTIVDGVITSPRAGFEISQRCPDNYRALLLQCLDNGWIKPVAYMTERELIFMGLTR